MEIPYGELVEYNCTWLRTHHGGQEHFNYSFNKDGTISPENDAELVFGLTDPTPCPKFKDNFANHLGWKQNRAEKREAEKEQDEKIEALVQKKVDEIIYHKFTAMQKMIEAQGHLIQDLQF